MSMLPPEARFPHHNTRTPFVRPGTPSIADCITRISTDASLAEVRARDLVSALHRLTDALNAAPETVPADPLWLQPRIAAVMPAAMGIADKTWSNITSNAKAALAECGIGATSRQKRLSLSPAWDTLWSAVVTSKDASLRIMLDRFVQFLDANDIAPESVVTGDLDAYIEALRVNTIRKDPALTLRKTRAAWNRAIDKVAGWPGQSLEAPVSDDLISLPLSTFPPSFGAELEALTHRLAHPDPLARGPKKRALRPATVRGRRDQILRFASAVVRAGTQPASLTGLKELMAPATLERGLRWFLARTGNTVTSGISNIAAALRATARKDLGLSETEFGAVKDLCDRLIPPRPPGLTAKNRKRLMVFDDPEIVSRFLSLADELWDAAQTCRKPRDRALQSEIALAVGLACYIPLRIRNLTQLDCEGELLRLGPGNVILQVPASRVKNHQEITFPVPAHLVERIDAHLAHRAGVLCPAGTRWLFPQRDGSAPMAPGDLGKRITQTIRKVMGIDVNPHLFRHLAAKLLLQNNPGHYELVRRILGHADTSTVWQTYVGFEADGATRLLAETVNDRKAPPAPKARKQTKLWPKASAKHGARIRANSGPGTLERKP